KHRRPNEPESSGPRLLLVSRLSPSASVHRCLDQFFGRCERGGRSFVGSCLSLDSNPLLGQPASGWGHLLKDELQVEVALLLVDVSGGDAELPFGSRPDQPDLTVVE